MVFHRHRILKAKRQKKGILIVIGIIILSFIWYLYENQRYEHLITTAVDPNDTTKTSFVINKGETVAEISKRLIQKGLIIDSGTFNRYLKSENLDRKIVAGRFLLQKSQTITEIASSLTEKENSQTVLTITEGSKIDDIDKKITALGLTESGTFIKAVENFDKYEKYPFLDKEKQKDLYRPLEGFLFPDTYYVDPLNFRCEDLIQMMLNNFGKKIDSLKFDNDKYSLFEYIVMASIVEKEVRTAKDLPIVAGILWKRLENNWQIGADATLLYKKSDNKIYYADLQKDSPYNTRKRTGLPPGPICNPGLNTISATTNPQKSPYFFYLTKPENGEVVYAITNEEHNINKTKYL